MDWILESERLKFRKIIKEDFNQLCDILQDLEIMYAWEHAFDHDEVVEWVEKNQFRYANEGFSYFAAIEKNTNEFIGVIGPLIEDINGVQHIGIGYILEKKYWGKGYASEGAKVWMDYAFNYLNADKVIAQIRPNNLASRKVAENLGMKIESEFMKRYNNTDMPHLIYSRAKSSEVEINGTTYTFSNKLGEDKKLLKSFNKLSKSNFGISFDHVGGQYEPHVLSLNGKVCANVSVNQIPFNYRGERKLYIQLGTVMTDLEFRNKGLSRWLMEHIIECWKNRCDLIYLFANDSVLNFYPKFGFEKMSEYEYIRSGINPNNTKVQKLDMNDEKNIQLLLKKYEQGNPFSALYMAENEGLLSFYCMGLLKENVYYSPRYDVVIIAEKENAKTRCYDILGESDNELLDILGEISSSVEDEIVLGFTPLNTSDFICQKHIEEDATLFLHCSENGQFNTDKMMFPIISHA